MITCQEADILAAAMSVGSIEDAEERPLHVHLVGCADCRRAADEYMAAAARLPLVLEPLQPSPNLRGRLMRAVYAEAALREATLEPVATARERAATPRREPPAMAQRQRGGPALWERLWAAIPSGRVFTLVGATAAILVIALASYVGLRRSAPSTAPPTAVAITLSGQQEAPNAHGTLLYSRETHTGMLTVTGLPGPTLSGRVGSVYEVWLITAHGAAVAAAYLTQSPDGRWTAAVQGDLSHYATVAATVEPSGGSKAPTGVPVIQGSMAGV